MKILMTASEMTPFVKTGGLADVMGSLPTALSRRGHDVSVFIPYYRCVEGPLLELVHKGQITIGSRRCHFDVLRISTENQVHVYAIRKEEYFDRAFLYNLPHRDYDDNAERFTFFSRAVVHAINHLGLKPHVVHAHDWQTALVPVYLALEPNPLSARRRPSVFTIHNIAYQGVFEPSEFRMANLPDHLFSPHGIEFYGRLNFLKGGILFADRVTTVSPTYAEEIQTPDYGFGLEGVTRSRRSHLQGILNGIDSTIWDPSRDDHLAEKFTPATLKKKSICKQSLAAELKIDISSNKPLVGMVTRFAQQKGIELFFQTLPEMIKRGACFVVLGNGDAAYENQFRQIAVKYPQHLSVRIGFDDGLAHRIYGGCDFLLMPSLYEPCGLSQLYALRYGTIPIVRATGGLNDTIEPWNPKTQTGTGFKFTNPTPIALLEAFDQAMRAFRQLKAISALRESAMACDFSWEKSATEYENLYQSLQ